MKKTVFITSAVIFFFVFPLIIQAQDISSSKETPLIFIGQDTESIESYVNDLGHVPDGFMIYSSIQRAEGLDFATDSGAGEQYAQGLIDEYPEAQLQIGFYMVDALEDIVKGRYDDHIKELADWFKENQATKIYFRIGYEFDNPQNGYDSEEYILVYRYLVDKLRGFGVSNVFYVWHSCAAFVSGSRERWYPGDDYVDWIGLSYFDSFAKSNMESVVKIAKKHNKRLMIAEASPRGKSVEEGVKTWNSWYKRLFDFARKNNVEIICYINWDWEDVVMFRGQGWGNSRVQDNDTIKQFWLNEVAP